MATGAQDIQAHYARGDLVARMLEAMRAAGKDPDAVSADDPDLADEFHLRGREATVELADLAGLRAGMHVLDVGCGIGGPARWLAARRGCRVVGVDLTAEYVRVAEWLTGLLKLSERARFEQADALALPFEDGSFDVVWSQHAAMNIEDRAGLYAEMRRVVRPGGTVALYDIVAGPGGTPHFPVPWASRPEQSHLVTPDAMRGALERAGLEVVVWRDAGEPALAWVRARAAAARDKEQAPLGRRLTFGDPVARNGAQSRAQSGGAPHRRGPGGPAPAGVTAPLRSPPLTLQ